MIFPIFSASYNWGCWCWCWWCGGGLPLWCPPPLHSAPSPRLQVLPHPGRAGGMRWIQLYYCYPDHLRHPDCLGLGHKSQAAGDKCFSPLPWQHFNLNVSAQRRFQLPAKLFTQKIKYLCIPEIITGEFCHICKNFNGICKNIENYFLT